jgi:hypothetical protein
MTKSINKVGKIIRKTGGKFFYCEFVKADGTLRKMIGRIGVKKHVTGGGLPYDPKDYNLQVVWDAQKRAYRMLNLLTLKYLRCGDITYKED